MNKKGVLVTSGPSSKNFSFVVVFISHMTFLLEETIEKPGFIPYHVLRTTTV